MRNDKSKKFYYSKIDFWTQLYTSIYFFPQKKDHIQVFKKLRLLFRYKDIAVHQIFMLQKEAFNSSKKFVLHHF